MKKFIRSTCLTAMAVITSVYAEQPTPAMNTFVQELKAYCMQQAHAQLSVGELKAFKNIIREVPVTQQILKDEYPAIYNQIAQSDRCNYYLNTLKTLCQKGGAPVKHFVLKSLAAMKRHPVITTAIALPILAATVYGAAQLCMAYGIATTYAQSIINAYALAGGALITAGEWTAQTAQAAGSKIAGCASAAKTYIASFITPTESNTLNGFCPANDINTTFESDTCPVPGPSLWSGFSSSAADWANRFGSTVKDYTYNAGSKIVDGASAAKTYFASFMAPTSLALSTDIPVVAPLTDAWYLSTNKMCPPIR
jgi:hypothetical protein